LSFLYHVRGGSSLSSSSFPFFFLPQQFLG
jgi:hypothetical protein